MEPWIIILIIFLVISFLGILGLIIWKIKSQNDEQEYEKVMSDLEELAETETPTPSETPSETPTPDETPPPAGEVNCASNPSDILINQFGVFIKIHNDAWCGASKMQMDLLPKLKGIHKFRSQDFLYEGTSDYFIRELDQPLEYCEFINYIGGSTINSLTSDDFCLDKITFVAKDINENIYMADFSIPKNFKTEIVIEGLDRYMFKWKLDKSKKGQSLKSIMENMMDYKTGCHLGTDDFNGWCRAEFGINYQMASLDNSDCDLKFKYRAKCTNLSKESEKDESGQYPLIALYTNRWSDGKTCAERCPEKFVPIGWVDDGDGQHAADPNHIGGRCKCGTRSYPDMRSALLDNKGKVLGSGDTKNLFPCLHQAWWEKNDITKENQNCLIGW